MEPNGTEPNQTEVNGFGLVPVLLKRVIGSWFKDPWV